MGAEITYLGNWIGCVRIPVGTELSLVLQKCPDRIWGPPSLSRYRGFFSREGGHSGWGM